MQIMTFTQQLLQYIPFFYVIWSDDLVTISEINVVQNTIEKDQTLSREEKDALLSWLNPDKPPRDSEMKQKNGAVAASACL